MNSVFVYNFKVDYVFIFWLLIGWVESGLLILLNEKIIEVKCIVLFNFFCWFVSISNLKWVFLEMCFLIKGIDKELVVFNLYLEVYDNGEGKIV